MKRILLTFLLACCWGPSYLCSNKALGSFSPSAIVFLRLFFASIFLFSLAIVKRKEIMPHLKLSKKFIIMGLFANAIPFMLITLSLKYLDSSISGIINGSVPLFTVVLASIVGLEKLNKQKLLGAIIGLVGIFFVFLPYIQAVSRSSLWGVFLMILASICYAIGMTYSKMNRLEKLPPLIVPSFQLGFAALAVTPMLFMEPNKFTLPLTSISLVGLSFLIFFATGLAFILYFKILEEGGPTDVATATLIAPVISLVLGIYLNGEQVQWLQIIGMVVILSAVRLILSAKKPVISTT